MGNKLELRFAGSGGQGLILAGIILAEAALLDGKNCIQTQSYGPEARGGASKSEVIISDDEIDYPKVQKPDILLALSQKAYDKYRGDLKEDGIIIIDSSIKHAKEINKVYSLPIIETAQKNVGRAFTANIVLLGAVTELTNIVTKDSLLKAVLRRVPKGSEKLNEIALMEGCDLVNKIMVPL